MTGGGQQPFRWGGGGVGGDMDMDGVQGSSGHGTHLNDRPRPPGRVGNQARGYQLDSGQRTELLSLCPAFTHMPIRPFSSA